ncbi:MAG: 2-C-methyl-D-erythritol 4-phosphate cytidylyltransferase [Acidothermus sp.]|nr:2-C-methyl-D-erythritol 4-phosphate cytidylyltransferase [Acidothermus sp.]MCL6538135.1 2-C-methyl-D-erythritol 4-phosphate cytidylyltransferase [Acidothermus sp.]
MKLPFPLESRRPASSHAAVVLAGGRVAGPRLGPDIALLSLAGRRLLSRAVATLLDDTGVTQIVIVIDPADADNARALLSRELGDVPCIFASGGFAVQASLANGVEVLADAITRGAYDLIVVHDAAFALAPPHLVREVIATARHFGAAVPYIGLDDFVWIDRMGTPLRFGRDDRIHIQTPQAFRAVELLHACRRAALEHFAVGTTAEAMERYCGRRVRGVPGDTRNVAIRSPLDLFAAEGVLATSHYALH